jgi:C_GCAxxG_C_C family probable redox protein
MTEKEREDKALAIQTEGFCCAQAVLGALQDLTGLDYETSLAVAAGFGSGCGTGELCGALSGAVMAIGLADPFTNGADQGKKKEIRTETQRCLCTFQDKYGCVTCRELVGKAKRRRCPEYVAYCAALAAEIINDEKEKQL